MILVGTHLSLAGQLRELRSRIGITTREVAEQSQKIAEAENNPEFYISNAWLTQLENTDSIPSVFKLFSLSVIYRVKFTGLLLLFGIDLERIEKHRIGIPPQDTTRATIEVYDDQRTVTFPIRFDPGFTVSTTNLLSRMVEVWGEIPIAMIQHLDLRHDHYGYIGLQDFTLHPLLRPGSFVQINERVRKIQPGKWRTEFDRPIYFVELRDGYACGWCELNRNDLLLIPHPLSPCSVKQYTYGTEAEIVGQVTGVAMRLVDADPHGDSETSKLLKRQ
ncbi:MAG TPA: helix-turn-helix transcriptional regulator [Candidatus Dormibacteraeota bacterium]|nr:helix-turn-helix transcriptional regulator [Candidatus Dormibacteraeota bacterium]